MKIFRFTLATLSSVLALSPVAWGQLAATPEVASAVEVAQQRYTASFPAHPQLYNGPEYTDYASRYPTHTGHQFYTDPVPQAGTVFYNNHSFTDISLLYDVVLDQVVLSLPKSPRTLRLLSENVRDFTMGKHRFVRLVADSAAAGAIRTGFYEVLADGQVQVLARRSKRLKEDLNQRFVEATFTVMDKYFLSKDGHYYAISRKGPLLKLLAGRNKELLANLRAQKLSFDKAHIEASVVRLANYYNSLPLH